MVFFTNFKEQQDFRGDLEIISKKLLTNFEKTQRVLCENLYALEPNSFQYIARLLKADFRNRTEKTLFSILIRDAYRVECLSAGAGLISFILACQLIHKLIRSNLTISNEVQLMNQWQSLIEKVKKNIETSAIPITKNQLKSVVKHICENNDLFFACWKALKIAGLEGKIFIENGKQPFYSVELKDGFNFKLKPYKFFLDHNGLWNRQECKILVVDGFVEKVSEIDQILNKAFEVKQSIVIVAHGFSEEVVSTLFLNQQKNLIDVIPLRIKQDVNNLNVVNDIGIACGMDPISSLKGQMLTFVKFEDLPIISRIRVTEPITTIENPKAFKAVENQINALLIKRQENSLVEDLQDIIDGRIKSLIPNSVLLYLPEMDSFKNDAYRARLDNSFRMCKTLINYGIAEHKALDINPENEFEKIVLDVLKETFLQGSTHFPIANHFPMLSLFLGIMVSGKSMLLLLSSGGHVEIEIPEKYEKR